MSCYKIFYFFRMLKGYFCRNWRLSHNQHFHRTAENTFQSYDTAVRLPGSTPDFSQILANISYFKAWCALWLHIAEVVWTARPLMKVVSNNSHITQQPYLHKQPNASAKHTSTELSRVFSSAVVVCGELAREQSCGRLHVARWLNREGERLRATLTLPLLLPLVSLQEAIGMVTLLSAWLTDWLTTDLPWQSHLTNKAKEVTRAAGQRSGKKRRRRRSKRRVEPFDPGGRDTRDLSKREGDGGEARVQKALKSSTNWLTVEDISVL